MIQITLTHVVTQEILVETNESGLDALAAKVGLARNPGESTYDFVDRVWDANPEFIDALIAEGEVIDEDIEDTLDEVNDDDEE